LNTKISRKSC